MSVGIAGIGFAHDDKSLAAWACSPRSPPFASIQHVIASLASDGELDISGIRTGHRWFGHGEGRTNLTVEQRGEPLLLLLFRAKLSDDFHIACVRGSAVKDLGRPAHAAHHLSQGSVLQ